MTALIPGEKFYVIRSLTVEGRVAQRGETITVTEQMIADSADRNGDSWLSDVADDEAQIRRWGAVHLAPGEAPADVLWWNLEGDDASRDRARDEARWRAAALKDPVARQEALQEVRDTYGSKPSSRSVKLHNYDESGRRLT
ncbi:hypothetical protein M3D75_02005 [Microbacterium enclense]|uniref:hypothetical protein n=1 Tax=Microbacterium enclense TaxID=993073 RepID=UPI0021A7B399|nr:hypothetical protein [Microbacterium enclense]MCT2084884.1 hypothetical protein [Microbacterium enclense]